jgi:AbrB family looped-hinge helix DNA binding protein
MTIVKVSPKFQVVIPKAIREALGIEVGQQMQVIQYEGRIEFIPHMSTEDARGFLEGIDTSIEREQDRV